MSPNFSAKACTAVSDRMNSECHTFASFIAVALRSSSFFALYPFFPPSSSGFVDATAPTSSAHTHTHARKNYVARTTRLALGRAAGSPGNDVDETPLEERSIQLCHGGDGPLWYHELYEAARGSKVGEGRAPETIAS